MLRSRSPYSLPPSLIEPLESRRLYSVTGARLAIWADPGVVDPNSMPPEEVAELEAGTGDASGEEVPGDVFINYPDDGTIDENFDPIICYFMPFSGEDGEVSVADNSETSVDGEEILVDANVDGELVDPAVCYMFPPQAVDGEEVLYTTAEDGGEVESIDPDWIRRGVVEKSEDEESVDGEVDGPIFYALGGVVESDPGEEGIFVVDPLPIDNELIDPIPVEEATPGDDEVIYTMTGFEEPVVLEEPPVVGEPGVLEEPLATDVLVLTAADLEPAAVPEVEPVQADPAPAFQAIQVKLPTVSWANTGTGLASQILGTKDTDDEDALAALV